MASECIPCPGPARVHISPRSVLRITPWPTVPINRVSVLAMAHLLPPSYRTPPPPAASPASPRLSFARLLPLAPHTRSSQHTCSQGRHANERIRRILSLGRAE